ncbi:MAG: hypothetical protein KDA41_19525 [Planctomycetales bacterium]|nr:hypothetical protein [Planctomycetales bacterium]
MSATYETPGMRFMYPENWSVVEEDATGQPQTATVAHESGAFWSLALYDAGAVPVDLAAEALAALRSEYPDLEAEVSTQGPAGADLDVVGYDVQFYVQQLVAAGRVRAFRHAGKTALVLCQAEDRQFDQLAPVFDAMTVSYARFAEG